MRYLAMDLDRTLIPNGPEPDDGSLPYLTQLLQKHSITPLFVTARRILSVEQAIQRYTLPIPQAVIGQVGTTIHLGISPSRALTEWEQEIHALAPAWNREKIFSIFQDEPELVPQERKEQNSFKISYFLYDLTLFTKLQKRVSDILLEQFDNAAILIASKDLNANLAYFDILPQGVNKCSALDFYCRYAKISPQEILFAGDSENDLSLFLSPYDTIIVNNAEKALKSMILEKKKTGSHFEAYPTSTHNGNYSSGIIQGLYHHNWLS